MPCVRTVYVSATRLSSRKMAFAVSFNSIQPVKNKCIHLDHINTREILTISCIAHM